MRVNLTRHGSVQFRVLSDDDIERIVLAAYEVPPLPDAVNAAIDKLLATADERAAAEQTALL